MRRMGLERIKNFIVSCNTARSYPHINPELCEFQRNRKVASKEALLHPAVLPNFRFLSFSQKGMVDSLASEELPLLKSSSSGEKLTRFINLKTLCGCLFHRSSYLNLPEEGEKMKAGHKRGMSNIIFKPSFYTCGLYRSIYGCCCSNKAKATLPVYLQQQHFYHHYRRVEIYKEWWIDLSCEVLQHSVPEKDESKSIALRNRTKVAFIHSSFRNALKLNVIIQ